MSDTNSAGSPFYAGDIPPDGISIAKLISLVPLARSTVFELMKALDITSHKRGRVGWLTADDASQLILAANSVHRREVRVQDLSSAAPCSSSGSDLRIKLIIPLPQSMHVRLSLESKYRGLSREELAREILWEWIVNAMSNEGSALEVKQEAKKEARTPGQYHTTHEIRDLIRAAIPAMIEWFGDSEFRISTVRDFLSRKTTLRPGDKEIVSKVIRWESQVSNAIDIKHWPECPIVPSERTRYYRIARIHLDAHALAENQD